MSLVTPSTKYSWARSPVRFVNGRTAMDGPVGIARTGSVAAPWIAARLCFHHQAPRFRTKGALGWHETRLGSCGSGAEGGVAHGACTWACWIACSRSPTSGTLGSQAVLDQWRGAPIAVNCKHCPGERACVTSAIAQSWRDVGASLPTATCRCTLGGGAEPDGIERREVGTLESMDRSVIAVGQVDHFRARIIGGTLRPRRLPWHSPQPPTPRSCRRPG